MSEGRLRKPESRRGNYSKDTMPRSELWIDGLICAFEFVKVQSKTGRAKSYSKAVSRSETDDRNGKTEAYSYGRRNEATAQCSNRDSLLESASLTESGNQENSQNTPVDEGYSQCSQLHAMDSLGGSRWVPIGWARISELVQKVQVDAGFSGQHFDFRDDEDDLTVADVAAPYWERPGGPIWWCHVAAGHPFVDSWLSNADWLHPAISNALRDESRLISEKMKHLLYEVE